MKKYRKKVFRVVSVVLMSVIMICSLMACGSKENSENAGDRESG